jgi:hypothetical protein
MRRLHHAIRKYRCVAVKLHNKLEHPLRTIPRYISVFNVPVLVPITREVQYASFGDSTVLSKRKCGGGGITFRKSWVKLCTKLLDPSQCAQNRGIRAQCVVGMCRLLQKWFDNRNLTRNFFLNWSQCVELQGFACLPRMCVWILHFWVCYAIFTPYCQNYNFANALHLGFSQL